MWWLLLLAGCWGDNAYILEGTVIEMRGSDQVLIDHQAIERLNMPAMVMPFDIRDPKVAEGLQPGDRIYARMIVDQQGMYLERVRVTGKGVIKAVDSQLPDALRVGQRLPNFTLEGADGTPIAIGEGQPQRTAVAFLYTRCPVPEFCPALVARFQALQTEVGGARLVAITLDPAHDTAVVLTQFAEQVGANPKVWQFARTEQATLQKLASLASLSVVDQGAGKIEHGARMWVLDADGTLLERYDDNRWPLDRVIQQLKTGGPVGAPGSDGTMTVEGK